MPLTDAEVDYLLERYDQTDPALQRKIVAELIADKARNADLLKACEDLADWARRHSQADNWPAEAERAWNAIAKARDK